MQNARAAARTRSALDSGSLSGAELVLAQRQGAPFPRNGAAAYVHRCETMP